MRRPADHDVRGQVGSPVAGSLLSAPAHAALAAVGLAPAGVVMGCIVSHLSWSGANCGGYRNTANGSLITPVLVTGRNGGSGFSGYAGYVAARYQAYDTALARLLTEAVRLGAAGVVGVSFTWNDVDSGADELTALGTAVVPRGPGRPDRERDRDRDKEWDRGEDEGSGVIPFCTELSGEDVARSMLSGWVPLGPAIGLAVAVKHEDQTMRRQKSWLRGPGNVEVAGLSKVLSQARAQARLKLTDRARTRLARAKELGPDSGSGLTARSAQVVLSSSHLTVGTRSCAGGPDHFADARLTGTVLVRRNGWTAPEPVCSLSILPLDQSSAIGPQPAAVRSRSKRGGGSTDE